MPFPILAHKNHTSSSSFSSLNLAILEQPWRVHLVGDLVAELGMQKAWSICHSCVLE